MPYGLCADCRYVVNIQDPDMGPRMECRIGPPTSATIVSDLATLHYIGKFTTVTADLGCWQYAK